MVWALKNPGGFGDYFPDGTFAEWDEQLETHFNETMTEEERANYGDWYVRYKGEICDKLIKDNGSVNSHEWPTEFKTNRSYKSLSSLIKTENRILAVDESLKEVIENLEPGVHQFSPLRIKSRSRIDYPVPYFVMAIRQFRESYLPVEGTYSAHHGGDGRYFADGYGKEAFDKLQLSADAIGNAHLWRESGLLDPNIFLSDALKAAIDDAGLRIFRHYQVKVV